MLFCPSEEGCSPSTLFPSVSYTYGYDKETTARTSSTNKKVATRTVLFFGSDVYV